MNILMLTAAMDIGGAETHILELSRELSRRGHSVTVASKGGVYVRELEDAGIRHLTVPLHTKNPLNMLKSKKMLSQHMKNGEYDVVHAHARIPGFVGCGVAKKYGVPFVTTFHGVYDPVWYLRLLTKVGKYTLAVSEDVREYLMKYYGTPRENIAITVNGIDTDKFEREDTTPVIPEMAEGDNIVCVTRLDRDPSWHVFRMIEAMPMIAETHPGARLIIVGGGDVLEEVRAEASAMNETMGADRITVAGPRTDIAQILKSAKIFVGVSRAAMEAMATRVPVILSGAQGHMGIYTRELEDAAVSTNFCCRDRDVADAATLGEAVTELLSMTDEALGEMGDCNRDVIIRLYSVGRMADDAEALYKRIIG